MSRRTVQLANRERTMWMVALFLVIGVTVPTASVLWFINESARSETARARQTVADAYRGQLRLIHDRIDSLWSERATFVAQKAVSGMPAAFARLIAAGVADSVVLLDDQGVPLYPAPVRQGTLDADPARAEWRD